MNDVKILNKGDKFAYASVSNLQGFESHDEDVTTTVLQMLLIKRPLRPQNFKERALSYFVSDMYNGKRIILLLTVIASIYSFSKLMDVQRAVPKGEFGIDISHHNGVIEWDTVKKYNNLQFVYIKATEGATHVDKYYVKNIKGASEAGFDVGSYHYFRMTSSAHDQFKNFITVVDRYRQDLIPMVDVETTDGHSVSETRDSLNVFIGLLKSHFGENPMVYGLINSYNKICGQAYNRYNLYIGSPDYETPQIIGDGEYTIWQYSSKGKIKGIPNPVDMARFNEGRSIRDIRLCDSL